MFYATISQRSASSLSIAYVRDEAIYWRFVHSLRPCCIQCCARCPCSGHQLPSNPSHWSRPIGGPSCPKLPAPTMGLLVALPCCVVWKLLRRKYHTVKESIQGGPQSFSLAISWYLELKMFRMSYSLSKIRRDVRMEHAEHCRRRSSSSPV